MSGQQVWQVPVIYTVMNDADDDGKNELSSGSVLSTDCNNSIQFISTALYFRQKPIGNRQT